MSVPKNSKKKEVFQIFHVFQFSCGKLHVVDTLERLFFNFPNNLFQAKKSLPKNYLKTWKTGVR